MMKYRSAGGVTSLGQYVYALGGHDGLSIFDSVERYDPQSNTWIKVTPMLNRRCRLGVATLNGMTGIFINIRLNDNLAVYLSFSRQIICMRRI